MYGTIDLLKINVYDGTENMFPLFASGIATYLKKYNEIIL